MSLLRELCTLPLPTALKRAGWSRERYSTARTDPAFAAAADAAIGQREARLHDIVDQAALDDWKAGAWLLERTAADYREVKEVQVQVQRELERVLDLLESKISASAYREVVHALAEHGTQGQDSAPEPVRERKLLGSG